MLGNTGTVPGIEARFRHAFHAPRAKAKRLVNDVQPETVAIREQAREFAHLLADEIQVGCIETELVKAGIGRALAPAIVAAVFVDRAPLGMLSGNAVVDADREINLRVHTNFVTSVHHRTGQIEIRCQVRVALAKFRFVVTPTVMAHRKDIDAVDVAAPQRLLPMALIPSGADAGDVLGGVKIEVNLAERDGHDAITYWLSRTKGLTRVRSSTAAKASRMSVRENS